MGSMLSKIRQNTGLRPDLKEILLGLDGNLGAIQGRVLYVDAVDGQTGNDGLSWERPLLTMAGAFAKVKSGETIVFRGKIQEQISTPVQVHDVTVIGAGTKPRHADTQPVDPYGVSHGATWKSTAVETATTPCVTVRQQGWRFINILFDAPSDDAAIEFFRDGGAGNDERDGSHGSVIGCRIVGGSVGIQESGGCGHLLIQGNDLFDLTTAIKSVTGAGIGQPMLRSKILDNNFVGNTNDIVVAGQQMLIKGNSLSPGATKNINLAGGVGSNKVTENQLPGTYSDTLYTEGTNDDWNGNAASTGFTAAVPA